MGLDTWGDRKTALFVIISDTDDTFNFVVSILYTQLFNLLCDKADDVYGGRLPVHVRCLLDEFANIGQIPKFEKLIATIRSREISASIILQSQSQLKAIYKDNADTIVGNCDTTLFLGGKEKTTLKEIFPLLTWLTRSKPIRSVARQSRKRSPLSGRSFWQIRNGNFQLAFPTGSRFLCLILCIALSLTPFAGNDNRQSIFPAQLVAHVPYAVIAALIGIVFVVVYEIDRAENNVVMNVSFVNVRRQDIFMLPFGYCVGKLPPDFVGGFIIHFPRLKGLYQMKG